VNFDLFANDCLEKACSGRFQVLSYHKVSPEVHPFFEPLQPAIFEQQMRFLKRCYNVLDLQELVDRSRYGEVPERAVAITFDDGYSDNYEYAFPILRNYDLPATIFVATAAIDNRDILWHDRIFDAFRFATRKPGAREERRILNSAINRARGLSGEALSRFIEELEQGLQPDFAGRAKQSMLTWEQIQEMHRSGIQFGSHTVTHPIVSRLSKERLERELRESQAELSDRLRTPITAFAYPNGRASDYNDDVKSALRRCGYSCAVTACTGFNTASTDPLELKRGRPWQNEIELFRFSFFLQRHGLES
jgi:peptidoglycan/xylan/chitin deacetylase (PgdA/CDA1 family)